jgi:8-oxo-dGTP pyrophosphatase MutT (NUDIX family)
MHCTLDYTVGAFIVHQQKVLLVKHKKLHCWICPGGHIEANEDPLTALHREVKEETNLRIRILARTPVWLTSTYDETILLTPPHFMDIHPITADHHHVGMFWICAILDSQDTLRLSSEHHDLAFFARHELEELTMWPAIRQYAQQALRHAEHF